mmetsp:Transcript_2481/g.3901  ORF Transcript_2481/g.3901 Transcript_2481/m.3901 type:complete len:231 (-) Transcript_2481:361-1053(-)
MSNLHKEIPKRKYRERAQPQHRRKLGMLEKKKDYKERAVDYHKKQDQLNTLREEAYFRNPEEFNFKMIRAQVVNGKHQPLQEEEPIHALKKRKTQDESLVTMRLLSKTSQAAQLKSTLHETETPKPNTHIIFVSKEEAGSLDLAEKLNTDTQLIGNPSNRLTKEQLKTVELTDQEANPDYHKLEEITKEQQQLQEHLRKIHKQKELMKPGKKKLVDEDHQVYKWFWERKR